MLITFCVFYHIAQLRAVEMSVILYTVYPPNREWSRFHCHLHLDHTLSTQNLMSLARSDASRVLTTLWKAGDLAFSPIDSRQLKINDEVLS